jgi:hypothetical protein
MGKKTKELEAKVKLFRNDLNQWGLEMRNASETMTNLRDFVKQGFEMLYHQAVEMNKKYRVGVPDPRLEQIAPPTNKELANAIAAVKQSGARLLVDTKKYRGELAKRGEQAVNRCIDIGKTVDLLLAHKEIKGSKSKGIETLKKLKVELESIRNEAGQILHATNQLMPEVTDAVFTNLAKLSDKLKLSELAKIAPLAADDVRKGVAAYDKNFSRLEQARQASATSAAALAARASSDLDKDLGEKSP